MDRVTTMMKSIKTRKKNHFKANIKYGQEHFIFIFLSIGGG